MATITIASRMPYGLILEVGKTKVTIEGLNKSLIIGAQHMTTEVDAEFWSAWKEANSEFSALKNETIFEIADKRAEKSILRDAFEKLTGLEKVNPAKEGVVTTMKD